MTILISEIGNNHVGDLQKAKDMIRISKECGADMAKMQAFDPKDINGSMPKEFYELCAFNIFEYTELIQYGKEIGIEVFFSIFSKEFLPLQKVQNYKKLAAIQSQSHPRRAEKLDYHNVFISLRPNQGMLPDLKKAKILYASEYMPKDPHLDNISFLNRYYSRKCGYSDHTLGVEYCIEAIEYYECPYIEKHFTLTRDIYFKGKQFRDAVHGAMPYELERLAKRKSREAFDGMSNM